MVEELIMHELILRFNEKELNRFPLNNDHPIKIGRKNDNTIVINSTSISGHHAEITSDETGFLITDLESKNGTFVNNKPIKTHRIKNQDVIKIGKHELLFSSGSSIHPLNSKQLTGEIPLSDTDIQETAFIDTKSYLQMIQKDQSLGKKVPMLTIKFKDKNLNKYLLKHQSTCIGRNKGNDVVIDNAAVSGDHALITLKGSQFFIEDMNSKNGTFLNKVKIKKKQLTNGDIITIGRHEIIFEQSGNFTLAEIDAPLAAGNDSSSTMSTTVLNTKEYKEMLAENTPENGTSAALIFIKGGKGKVVLRKKMTRIGKDPNSDIVVKGFFVGKTSALISLLPNGYSISYQGGLSKPKVNGSKLKRATKLANADIIKVGSTLLEFRSDK